MFSIQLVINFYLFFLCSFILAVIILLASYLVSSYNPDSEKVSAYECGFDPYEDARNNFDVRFYLIALLFLIFSVQIDDFFFLILAVESSLEFIMSTFVVHCDSGSPDKTGVTALGFALFFGISLLYIRPEKIMTHIIKDSSGESFWVNLVKSREKSEDLATGVDRYGITRYFTNGPDTYTAKHSLTECLDLQLIVNQNGFWPGDLGTWSGVFAHTPGHTWYVFAGFGILSYLILSELNSYKSSVVEVIETLL